MVIHVDGTTEVKEFSKKDRTAVFEKAREYIGCKWLDNVVVQQFAPDVRMVYLVNDNGYADWGNDPKKVNQIATLIYNGDQKPSHYILGDVVMCWLIDTDDGGVFIGMSRLAAERISRETQAKVLPKAKELVAIPETVPAPFEKVTSYSSAEDLIKAMKGDTSVKPVEETIISGSDAKAEA